MNKEIFVQNVKELCLKRGVKPTNACKECGVGGSFLSDINRGQTPSVTKVEALAQYLGVTTSELLGEKEKPTPGDGGGLTEDQKYLINAIRSMPADSVRKLRIIVEEVISPQGR